MKSHLRKSSGRPFKKFNLGEGGYMTYLGEVDINHNTEHFNSCVAIKITLENK
jgi:hypothetical protein